jgi:hypothetical protein
LIDFLLLSEPALLDKLLNLNTFLHIRLNFKTKVLWLTDDIICMYIDEDDDYSASMTAILQRRASTRKVKTGKRRTSSPFDGSDRRRSSVFTTSSGE